MSSVRVYNFKSEGSLSCGRRESETLLAMLMVIVLCGGIGTVPRRFVKYNKYVKMQERQGKREGEDEGEEEGEDGRSPSP